MSTASAAVAAAATKAVATASSSGTPSPTDLLERAALSASRSSQAGEGSNVYMLFSGLLEVTVALLSIARSLAGFATLTVPSTVYAILHYSFTLRLSFPILASLTLAGLIAAFIWLRTSMRVYEKVREPPLDSDAGFSLHPDLAGPPDPLGLFGSAPSSGFGPAGLSGGGGGTLHDYLDEFLQAIRIFGFLERPVFHDLARHLQTRRLIAGDSLSLDHDGCFYIVIDGSVSVYAPLPPSAAVLNPAPALAATVRHNHSLHGHSQRPPLDQDSEDDDMAGYQLLHQVRNGGTLSSLFTILKLFTESSAPPREPPVATTPRPSYTSSLAPGPGEEAYHVPGKMRAQRSSVPPTTPNMDSNSRFADPATPTAPRPSLHPGLGAGFGGAAGPDPEQSGDPLEIPPAGFSQDGHLNPQHNNRSRAESGVSTLTGTATTPGFSPSTQSHPPPNPPAPPPPDVPTELTGTVARAKRDTTLAVIPAEAFRRLTKKYPNSAAHILQVILTRLSRVTMHTAHSYLGLTKEVMRAERVLNQTASTPLPASFYESGAVERLRQRFVKVNEGVAPTPPSAQGVVPGVDPRTRAAERMGTASLGSPLASFVGTHGRPSRSPRQSRSGMTLSSLDLQGPDAAMLATPGVTPLDTPATHTSVEAHRGSDPKRTSRNLDPGDLFTSTSGGDELQAQPPLQSPRSSKNAGFAGLSTTLPTPGLSNPSTTTIPPPNEVNDNIGWAADGVANFDLKEAVMQCISSSMGLVPFTNPPSTAPPSSASRYGESNVPSYADSPSLAAQDSTVLPRTGSSAYGSAWGGLAMLAEATAQSRGVREDPYSNGGSPTPNGTGRNMNTSGYPFPQMTLPLPFENDVEIKFFHAGDTIIDSGEREAGLFYVIDGCLDVSISSPGGLAAGQTPSPPMAPGSDGLSTNADHGGASDHGPKLSMPGGSEPKKPRTKPIYSVGRGGIAGYLATLLGAPSYVDVTARTDCYVGHLPAHAMDKLIDRRPTVLLSLCRRLLSLLSPTLLQIDAALDWQHVNAGQVIYRQGELADQFYLVINGRLRAIAADDAGSSQVHIANEFGMGDSVGELEVVTASPRTHTLHAIRDTELACIPVTLFRAVSALEPSLSIQLAQIIARRVSNALVQHGHAALPAHLPMPLLSGGQNARAGSSGPKRPATDMWRSNTNLKTVAIVPVTREVPIAAFASRLQAVFEPTTGEKAAYLNQSAVMGVLGRNAFNRMGKLKLAGWLADQEAKHRIVLYVVDTAVSSPWAQTSIRQADCVMLVGFGDDPSVGEYERLLLAIKTTARKELVLLHSERSVQPGSTRAWLRSRPWVSAHHHVEMPGIKKVPGDGEMTGSRATSASFNWTELARRAGTMTAATMPPLPPLAAVAAMAGVDDRAAAVRALKRLRGQIGSRLQRYREKRSDDSTDWARPAHLSDFSRLARRLCGHSVGLVLGGGGARGIAHLGVIRALEEEGVPIDLIGGTSIGSFVGGLYAKEAGLVPSYGRVKKFAGRMASLWRFVLDLTYPYVSYTTGHEFNRGVFKAFRDTHIEDMWLPFFCNTTNVTWSRMEIHTTGYAWRFIRGSMTLAGLVPPLVDEGDMLVDGGYMDNLPVSTMFAAGAARVFAVDVGSIDDTSPRVYGDTLSGWWLMLARWVLPWVPGTSAIRQRVSLIPSIPEIQARLAYVSSVQTLEEAKNAPGCHYIRLPVENYGTLEFGSFDAIHQAGYEAAQQMLRTWKMQGKLPPTAPTIAKGSIQPSTASRTGIRARRNSV